MAHKEMRNRVFLLGRSPLCVCVESRAYLGGLRRLPEAPHPHPTPFFFFFFFSHQTPYTPHFKYYQLQRRENRKREEPTVGERREQGKGKVRTERQH